ncbi:MAG TPA: class I adenylate-forming enzyme family protein [Xanthobacteraceae bacterium]|nr:class I adenylate-forming enzyme family protein [Xanthobacteraceae bacterium]
MTNTILTLLSAELIKQYTATGHWRDDTIYALVRAHARRAPDMPALRDRFRRVGYAALIAAADSLAADLKGHGVKPGARVAVWLPSRIESVVALLACSRNGYVCTPSLHRDHTAGQVVALLRRTHATAFIGQAGYGADAGRHDIFAEIGTVESLKHVYQLEADGSFPSCPALGRASASLPREQDVDARDIGERSDAVLRTAVRGHDDAVKTDPNQVVYLAFTSGTTGVPKGVMHSDNTLLANARAIAADWRIDADSVVYSLSPLSHNLGFGAMVMALAAGAELVIHDLPKGASLIDRLIETGASFLFGVPTHAIDLLRELRERDLDAIGRLTGFRISGAAAPREVVAELLAHGVVPQSGYGMTETCSHQYTLPDDDPKLIIESCGKACPGYEIKIWRTDDPDTEVPVGEVGQIGGRGASLMLGYFDDQAATEAAFNAHGWFMTGDLGWVDQNGYLRITGRAKDVIVRGGHNIYPARIEELAMRHPAVERVAAVPVADARLGEKVCLAVMRRAGARIAPDEMLAHLDALGLSPYDMPEFVLDIDHIPLTASGKILKRDLVERIAKGLASPVPVRWKAGPAAGGR